MEMAGTFLYDCFVVIAFINNQKRIPTMFHDDIITVLSVFSPLFSTNVWNYAQTLLIGAIVCDNQRTITAIPRIREGRPACHGIKG